VSTGTVSTTKLSEESGTTSSASLAVLFPLQENINKTIAKTAIKNLFIYKPEYIRLSNFGKSTTLF